MSVVLENDVANDHNDEELRNNCIDKQPLPAYGKLFLFFFFQHSFGSGNWLCAHLQSLKA